jgi:hypothetical protein
VKPDENPEKFQAGRGLETKWGMSKQCDEQKIRNTKGLERVIFIRCFLKPVIQKNQVEV